MSPIAPDYGQSLKFLNQWRPNGPWVLTAIDPERATPGTNTKTFGLKDEKALRKWLQTVGAACNIYFMVNPATRALSIKAQREDIAALEWLHVDVDPRVGEDLAAEQARILKLFSEPPKGVPKPTAVVFSGGGYQAFWRIAQPFEINGEPAKYEEAKRWNLQLELLFGGDHCHNVDRIMRLPGSINWPDERKRKKGRVPTLARVEWFNAGVHELKLFTPAPLVQDAGAGGFTSAKPAQVSGNIRRLASVDELPKGVSDACKVAIVQGNDPDNPKKHESRSEWLFWVCCELVRAGCDDETIFSVITDPDFSISESVLDKGTRAEKYALRQIERSREEAIDPWLRRLNERHAVVGDMAGRCRIISEIEDPGLNRSRISFQSFADFKNRYCNRQVTWENGNGKTHSMPAGDWWIKHAQRREYDTIVFAPGRDVSGAYNLWKGFAYDAKPGSCELYLAHVKDNICSGDENLFRYLLGWMANCVQHPDTPGHTAIVLRGRMGTGKGVFIKGFGNLFGRHFMQVSDSKHLVGAFNAHLRDCVVMFADEAFYAGDKKHESVLKMLVTEERITIEAKGVDAETAPNCVHLLMASNEAWVVPAGHFERRFVVLDVNDKRMQDNAYFSKILDELKNGGYGALLHLLMTLDLSSFDVRKLPKTKALLEQKMYSFSTIEEWWYAKLCAGEILEGEGWPAFVFCTELAEDYTNYARMWNATGRGNSTRLGRFLKDALPIGHEFHGQLSGTYEVKSRSGGPPRRVDRPRVYQLPKLEDVRKHWNDNFGGPYDWTSPRMVDVGQQKDPGEKLPF